MKYCLLVKDSTIIIQMLSFLKKKHELNFIQSLFKDRYKPVSYSSTIAHKYLVHGKDTANCEAFFESTK